MTTTLLSGQHLLDKHVASALTGFESGSIKVRKILSLSIFNEGFSVSDVKTKVRHSFKNAVIELKLQIAKRRCSLPEAFSLRRPVPA